MTDEEHNKYIAYSFLAHGAFQILMTLFIGLIFLLMFSIDPPPGQPGPPAEIFGIMFAVMFLFQFVFTAPAFVAAYALLKRRPWARLASIIAGVIAAMSVPVGTAACVYSMWFFFSDRWKSVYEPGRRYATPENWQIDEGTEPDAQDFKTSQNERDAAFQYREPPDWR